LPKFKSQGFPSFGLLNELAPRLQSLWASGQYRPPVNPTEENTMIKANLAVITVMAISLLSSCGKSTIGAGAGIPAVTPIVKAAAPTGLKGSLSASILKFLSSDAYAVASNLSVSDFQSRFFTTGPTAILNTILPNIDTIISAINSQTARNDSPCLTQAPVSYTIHPFGQSVTMYAQCYTQNTGQYSGDPGFVQFGTKDGVNYIYSAEGAEWQALIVTPISGSNGKYSVTGYIGLGYSNTAGCSSTWDGCSYGGMEISANSATQTFELAVAGMGFGYCGAQLSSDGTHIYATGSVDMGTSCLGVGTLCVEAGDGQTSATCTAAEQTFALTPIGRQSTASTAPLVSGNWGASAYPASGANLLFDGSSADDIHFGPTSPTSGVGSI
jgi:hypothetical protein